MFRFCIYFLPSAPYLFRDFFYIRGSVLFLQCFFLLIQFNCLLRQLLYFRCQILQCQILLLYYLEQTLHHCLRTGVIILIISMTFVHIVVGVGDEVMQKIIEQVSVRIVEEFDGILGHWEMVVGLEGIEVGLGEGLLLAG